MHPDEKSVECSFGMIELRHLRHYMAVVADENLAVAEAACAAEEDTPIEIDLIYW